MKISIKRLQNDLCIVFAEREKFGTQFKNFIFIAVTGLLALCSCSNDNNEQIPENDPRPMTFVARYGDVLVTRANIDYRPNMVDKVRFDSHDIISILSSNNANVLFTSGNGGDKALFTGTAVNDSKFYAIFPYTIGLALSGTTITGVRIPPSQWNHVWSNVGGSYSYCDPKAPIAWAQTTDTDLTFHNLCAFLKIHTTGPDHGGGWGSITISADQSLAGTFSLDTSTGTLTATAGRTSVTIGEDDPQSLNKVCQRHFLYIAIAPGTYSNFTIVSKGVSGLTKTKKSETSATFEAGRIYDFGDFAIQ